MQHFYTYTFDHYDLIRRLSISPFSASCNLRVFYVVP